MPDCKSNIDMFPGITKSLFIDKIIVLTTLISQLCDQFVLSRNKAKTNSGIFPGFCQNSYEVL